MTSNSRAEMLPPWIASLLRRWRLLVAVPLLAAACAAGVSWLRGPQFVAQSRFSPEGGSSRSVRLGPLAAQFGLDAALGGETGESLAFYAEVLRSHDLLHGVLRRPLGDGQQVRSLLDRYGGNGPESERLRRATKALTDRMSIGIDPEPSLLTLRTRAPSAELAVAINQALLDAVSTFNQERRQSRAMSERRFLEERLAETQRELETAEAELAAFMDRNRRFVESPLTAVEAERLQRRVTLAGQKYISLAESFEQARLDEVRNTPVITVIEAPAGTVRPARLLLRDAAFGFVLGVVVAVLAAAAAEQVGRPVLQSRPATQAV
jgi:uncharacterized protein involved in exopolysaccharide biosynthesis